MKPYAFTLTIISYGLVTADVAHSIRFNSKVFAVTTQQVLHKAYEGADEDE